MDTLTILMTSNLKVESPAKIACFDLDWTLIYPQKGLFPTSITDFDLLPNRKEVLQQLINDGFNLVVMTNQLSKNDRDKNFKISLIQTFINLLNLPILVLISTADDEYRKPKIGMWQALQQLIPNIKSAFYVGDAAGRPGDFSDSDLKFAENSGISFYYPEQIFPPTEINLPNVPRTLILMVGAPGIDKKEYYQKYIEPYGYEYIETTSRFDKLLNPKNSSKHKNPVLVPELILKQGKNLVVNMKLSSSELRQEYYSLAEKYGYLVVVLYFTIDPLRSEREKEEKRIQSELVSYKTSSALFQDYFQTFTPPSVETIPGLFFKIDRL